MLNEVTAEMFNLTKDLKFIRNLSLTLIIAIAGVFVLSDLKQTTSVSEQSQITNMSHSQTKFVVRRK